MVTLPLLGRSQPSFRITTDSHIAEQILPGITDAAGLLLDAGRAPQRLIKHKAFALTRLAEQYLLHGAKRRMREGSTPIG
jgi:hypothetical protein